MSPLMAGVMEDPKMSPQLLKKLTRGPRNPFVDFLLKEGRKEGKVEGFGEGIAKGLAKGIAKGIAKGEARGVAKGKAQGTLVKAQQDLLDVLKARFGSVSKTLSRWVLAQDNPKDLRRLLTLAAVAPDIKTFAAGIRQARKPTQAASRR